MSPATLLNRRIVLAKRPQATATLDCFRLEEAPIPAPHPGEVLLRTLWLSLDPYMRGRMTDAPSYATPVALGEVMTGGNVSRVEASLNPNFETGDLVVAYRGWQEFALSEGKDLVKLPPSVANPSYALGILGMPGFTAYSGFLQIGKPQAGETVVVAAATGAVGSVVGQIAKLKGCRVVGIAGGAEKCTWGVTELGFDECVDHRADNFEARLKAACPKGIDVYFENVGGRIFRAVVPLLNTLARVPLCGVISQYNEAASNDGDPNWQSILLRSLLVKRITLRGFIVDQDFGAPGKEFFINMQEWMRTGRLKYREDVVRGIENAPAAFLGLLAGRNFGKLLIQVSPPETMA
jgi:NADPH-dependent curcumin reductase CurA